MLSIPPGKPGKEATATAALHPGIKPASVKDMLTVLSTAHYRMKMEEEKNSVDDIRYRREASKSILTPAILQKEQTK